MTDTHFAFLNVEVLGARAYRGVYDGGCVPGMATAVDMYYLHTLYV